MNAWLWGYALALVVMAGAGVGVLHAQQRPAGDASLNQAISARVVTKSDATVLIPTRGLYVGDATACTLSLVFQADNTTGAGVAVTFANVQPGSVLPFQVAKVMAATTCTAVTALY